MNNGTFIGYWKIFLILFIFVIFFDNFFSQENRALAYQAGLKTENSSQETKFPVSEYQREYEWKKFAIGDSPLLNAEKIVFDSHTNIPRFVRDKVPRKTEYQSRFSETRRVTQKEHEDKEENVDEKSEGMIDRFKNLTHFHFESGVDFTA